MMQFDVPLLSSHARYTPRHAVFGILTRGSKILVVARRMSSRAYFELPGGGVGEGETEEQALCREFREETGTLIEPLVRLSEAGQYYRRSTGDKYTLNYGGFWIVGSLGYDETTLQPDHEPCWMEAASAIVNLRLSSHAWFVSEWLRWAERDKTFYPPKNAEDEFRRRARRRRRSPASQVPELVGNPEI